MMGGSLSDLHICALTYNNPQMAEAPGSKLKEAVEIINSCYPEEIVKYYSPSYSQQLLEKLDTMAAAGQA